MCGGDFAMELLDQLQSCTYTFGLVFPLLCVFTEAVAAAAAAAAAPTERIQFANNTIVVGLYTRSPKL